MDTSDTTASTGADTLIGVLDEAAALGYDTQQIARADGRVECTGCSRMQSPASLRVERVRRLEGASDAADQLLVACSVCPSCERRGVLTLTYGPNAGDADEAVLRHLDLSDADSSPAHPGAEPRHDPGDEASTTRRPLNVLIGVDETPASREAVETAYEMFGPQSSYTIVCIYERQPFIVGGLGIGTSLAGMYARLDESVGRQLAGNAATTSRDAMPTDADVDFHTDVGHAGSNVAEAAVSYESDVIVIGSHDTGFWQRLFTPSVGKYLVDNAPCPVLVVR